jgi:hypothetical protein
MLHHSTESSTQDFDSRRRGQQRPPLGSDDGEEICTAGCEVAAVIHGIGLWELGMVREHAALRPPNMGVIPSHPIASRIFRAGERCRAQEARPTESAWSAVTTEPDTMLTTGITAPPKRTTPWKPEMISTASPECYTCFQQERTGRPIL